VQAAPLSSDYDRLRADQEWQKTTEIKAAYSHAFAEDGHEALAGFQARPPSGT
jgi:hypothetical protein